MSIEQSNGKARPTLVRASDLHRVPNVAVVEAAAKRTEGRTDGGQFAAGNRHGLGARWKASIKKSLGRADDGSAELVYRDALRIYLATLRAMPSDVAPVRSLAALHARHMALHGYFSTLAVAVGLETDAGAKLQARADGQSQRAERVLVSCIDVATKLAPKAPRGTVSALRARVDAALEQEDADGTR